MLIIFTKMLHQRYLKGSCIRFWWVDIKVCFVSSVYLTTREKLARVKRKELFHWDIRGKLLKLQNRQGLNSVGLKLQVRQTSHFVIEDFENYVLLWSWWWFLYKLYRSCCWFGTNEWNDSGNTEYVKQRFDRFPVLD